MKRKIRVALIVLLTLIASLLIVVGFAHPQKEMGKYYPRAMVIVDYIEETDEVICEDAVCLEWSFYGKEDLEIGDLVICTMYDECTTETIIDDSIVDVVWSGYIYPTKAIERYR